MQGTKSYTFHYAKLMEPEPHGNDAASQNLSTLHYAPALIVYYVNSNFISLFRVGDQVSTFPSGMWDFTEMMILH
jgi:hypothetical protein